MIATTGRTTPHGCETSASWFSWIIVPQLAPFGSVEKPRKASEAMRAIEYVKRRLASTISGERMFGKISPRRIRQRATPSASAAATKSRSTTGCAAPRVTRATRGIVVRPTASTISQDVAPSVVTATSASMICGNARITSIPRMSTSSSQLRE